MSVIHCAVCGKMPHEIAEYIEAAQRLQDFEEMTPAQYVAKHEGTYNRNNGKFWCTSCYISIGMPLGTPQ